MVTAIALDRLLSDASSSTVNARRFATVGFAVGLALWLTMLLIEVLTNTKQLNVDIIAELHAVNPSWWIIDLLPCLIGFFSYGFGKSLHQLFESRRKEDERRSLEQDTTLAFTKELCKGMFDIPIGINRENEMNLAVLGLRDYLVKSEAERKKKVDEDAARSWAAEGLALFGEILRVNYDSLDDFAYAVISNLVKYIKATQGGFFLLEDVASDSPYFNQLASFAYDRKRLVRKRVEWGSGLIGACAYEKEPIYMTDIPSSYVSITSGLGSANPNCLFVIPLIVDDEVQGVMEIASFNRLNAGEIEFVEKLSSVVAATVKNVIVAHRTSLLLEQSQQQSELLQIQEEEMHQSIEELHAAREEAARKGALLANFTESVNQTLVKAEYDLSGRLISANDRFLAKLGYGSVTEVKGVHISKFIDKKEAPWFFEIWNGLVKGGNHFEGGMKHVTKQGSDFWSMATYTCVRDNAGKVQEILFLGIDITELKELNLDLEGQVFALNNSTIKAEFSPSALLLNCNGKFLSTMKMGFGDLVNTPVFDFFDSEYSLSFEELWKDIVRGNPLGDQFKIISSKGATIWLHGTFSAVYNMYNEISKVIFISQDITSQKKLELETLHKTAQLLDQEKQLKASQSILVQKLDEIEAVKIRNEETLEGAMDAIITINASEEIEVFNRAAEDLFGYSKEEVIGNNIGMILPPEYLGLKGGEIVRFLQSDANMFKGVRTEVQIVDKFGEEKSILLTVSEARVGEYCTYTAFIQNISVELF